MSNEHISGHRGIKIAGMTVGIIILVVLVGWIWTAVSVRTDTLLIDGKVIKTDRLTLESEADNLKLPLYNFLKIKSRFVQQAGQKNGQATREYVFEKYTIFGIKVSTQNLGCWDYRPGVDGVTAGAIQDLGYHSGSIYCSGDY